MDDRTWEGKQVTITVDYDKCNGNGACVENCPMEAIRHSSC